MQDTLQKAVQLAQSGQRDEARALLLEIVAENPNHEAAWLWLASVAGSQQERIQALETVIKLNPSNAQARAALEKLGIIPPQKATGIDARIFGERPLTPIEGILVVLVITLIVALALFIGSRAVGSLSPDPTPTPTATPLPTITPTTTITLTPSITPTPGPSPTPFVQPTLPPTWTVEPTSTLIPQRTVAPSSTPRPTRTRPPSQTPSEEVPAIEQTEEIIETETPTALEAEAIEVTEELEPTEQLTEEAIDVTAELEPTEEPTAEATEEIRPTRTRTR